MNNPKFPHQCVVYRLSGVTSFNPNGEKKELYNGVCRKSGSDNIRSFSTGNNTTGKVDTCDYRISMPGIVKGIDKGDLVDVTDLVNVEAKLRVINIESTQLGKWETTDEQGRRKIVYGGTAVLCNLPSN